MVLKSDESTAILFSRCARCGNMMRSGRSVNMKFLIRAQRAWVHGLDRDVLDPLGIEASQEPVNDSRLPPLMTG